MPLNIPQGKKDEVLGKSQSDPVIYGVHPNAVLGEDIDIVENERIWGTTLWGFGNISDFLIPDIPEGMHAATHNDGLCPCSSVYLDGVPFFENGVVVGPTDEIVELAHKLGK